MSDFELSFGGWCAIVVRHLSKVDDALFKKAVEANEKESGRRAPHLSTSTSPSYLRWLRGDEPRGSYDEDPSSSSAREYAEFLIEEWRLFGPEGE